MNEYGNFCQIIKKQQCNVLFTLSTLLLFYEEVIWMVANQLEVYRNVIEALKVCYTIIDVAYIYENALSVGRTNKDSGLDRNKIFVSTKISPANILTQKL